MAEVKVPRFMISAPGSGSGKTTIVCGLLKALMEKPAMVAACCYKNLTAFSASWRKSAAGV